MNTIYLNKLLKKKENIHIEGEYITSEQSLIDIREEYLSKIKNYIRPMVLPLSSLLIIEPNGINKFLIKDLNKKLLGIFEITNIFNFKNVGDCQFNLSLSSNLKFTEKEFQTIYNLYVFLNKINKLKPKIQKSINKIKSKTHQKLIKKEKREKELYLEAKKIYFKLSKLLLKNKREFIYKNNGIECPQLVKNFNIRSIKINKIDWSNNKVSYVVEDIKGKYYKFLNNNPENIGYIIQQTLHLTTNLAT